MPTEVAFPPPQNGISDCNWLIYTGIACTGCNTNYCNANQPCPIGYRTTTTSRHCAEPRCGQPSPLPACPDTTPTYQTGPSTYIDGCEATIFTGTSCSSCPTICTIPTPPPGYLDIKGTGCKGTVATTTVDRICYSTCTFQNFPTPCTTGTSIPTPQTDTYGCTAYVQTGSKICGECLQFCTDAAAIPMATEA
jgi:hypothetical protein